TVSNRVRPHLPAPQEDQHIASAGKSTARHQGSWRRHLARQLRPLRSRILRSGTENPATPGQPVRPEVVTHVLGTFSYPCLRAGPRGYGAQEGFEWFRNASKTEVSCGLHTNSGTNGGRIIGGFISRLRGYSAPCRDAESNSTASPRAARDNQAATARPC